MEQRFKNLHRLLTGKGLDGLLISSQPNIRYLTDYEARDSCVIITPKEKIFITDFRYLYEAKRSLRQFSIHMPKDSLFKLIADLARKSGISRLGFESKNLYHAEYQKIKEELPSGIDFIPTFNLIERLRQVKDAEELSRIKEATRMAQAAFNMAQRIIRPGLKEIDIAQRIEDFLNTSFKCKAAFEIIVASGPNSSLPHHITSARKLKANEIVLIDMGVDFMGYKSDLTRVYFLGKISLYARRIHGIVLRAQENAIKRIKPGQDIKDIDKAARHYIEKSGFARYFGHATGHGIGLEVHEDPHISPRHSENLTEGNVFTVEPGIYLPFKFGIRIEDVVAVTKKGCEILSGNLNKSI